MNQDNSLHEIHLGKQFLPLLFSIFIIIIIIIIIRDIVIIILLIISFIIVMFLISITKPLLGVMYLVFFPTYPPSINSSPFLLLLKIAIKSYYYYFCYAYAYE